MEWRRLELFRWIFWRSRLWRIRRWTRLRRHGLARFEFSRNERRRNELPRDRARSHPKSPASWIESRRGTQARASGEAKSLLHPAASISPTGTEGPVRGEHCPSRVSARAVQTLSRGSAQLLAPGDSASKAPWLLVPRFAEWNLPMADRTPRRLRRTWLCFRPAVATHAGC
jgi:hypothetical protein